MIFLRNNYEICTTFSKHDNLKCCNCNKTIKKNNKYIVTNKIFKKYCRDCFLKIVTKEFNNTYNHIIKILTDLWT